MRGRKKQRQQKQRSPEPIERDEDEDTGADEDAAAPEKKEKPKGPLGRLSRSQTWAQRSEGLLTDAALDIGNAVMELCGPGAREGLLAYNGGSKMAAASEIEAAKSKAVSIAKHMKKAAKLANEAAEKADDLVKFVDVHYIDWLTGQGNLDEVEGGRHRESKAQPKHETAPEPAAAPAEASAPPPPAADIVPAAGPPVQAQEVAAALLDLMQQRAAQGAGAAPEAVEVQVEEPKGLLGDGRPRAPVDIPGIDPVNLETYEGPETLRELGVRIAQSDKSMGMRFGDLDSYVQTTLDSLVDIGDVNATKIELTDAERAELRAGLAEGAGIEEPEGGEEFQALLGRAREQGRADAPHNRQLHDAGILAEVLKISPTHPSAAVLFAAYMESYEGAGGAAAAAASEQVAQGGGASAPKQRGRRGGRRS